MAHNHQENNGFDFDAIALKLASPEKILEWSHGEVTKPETINYRTQRSEKNGLFDERIFGPEKDFECYCGKYKGIRYRGIVCEKCGVEITRSVVRRERMGHIELATPVSHIWFLRNIPSRMALVLGVAAGELEKVVYFAAYIVTEVNESERARLLKELDGEYKTKLKGLKDEKSKEKLKEVFLTAKRDISGIAKHKIIDDITYGRFSMKYGSLFEAETGAEAVFEIFKNINFAELIPQVEEMLEKSGAVDKKRLQKRLSLIKGMNKAGIRPEWMFLSTIPVIPAALRPMVALDGGRHATSDVNDLYRRVINRNNRLKKLQEIHAPNVILRNEKRILQEAVDSLIDNAIRHGQSAGAMSQAQRRPLKSLSDSLKGKQGIFRQNLLGKRVDYSGRSVIVVGPELRLDQCGLPKHMALELFKPFVISKLLEREIAFNIRGAGRLIDEATPEVWEILEEVISDKYVLLNRAPTLHRLGIQAFRPVLIEGNAIQVHPLVVTAYNADFDGDQMAVHVPLSDEAQAEAREIMVSNKNLLRPGNGTPIISVANQDIILGCYWMTTIVSGEKGEGKSFASPSDAVISADFDDVSYRAKVKIMPDDKPKYAEFEGKPFETSIGRILFNEILPDDYPFINKEIEKSIMSVIVGNVISKYDNNQITDILDKIKAFGFKYSTYSGTTFSHDDLVVPESKDRLVKEAVAAAEEVDGQYEEGLLSEEEKGRLSEEIWQKLRIDVEKAVEENLEEGGSVHLMWKSGARGNIGQITNMMGLKGLIAGFSGRVVDFPILSSSKEGLTPIEYFITTHGTRKGLGDTALNTARSGYLTRKLFDVAQDVVVLEEDCKTKHSIVLKRESLGGIEIPFVKSALGRYATADVEVGGKTIVKKGDYITREQAEALDAEGASEIQVRSPITCETLQGVCAKCYGRDLSTNKPVELGEAVGTVAAQAIGEPATQLTMRTFHAGGTAAVGGDIVSGLPRVEEVFEKRSPKNPAVISEVNGTVSEIKNVGREKEIVILLDEGEKKSGSKEKKEVEYPVHFRRVPLVKVGDKVSKGDIITDGSADLTKLFKYAGRNKTQEYIISEISRMYELQGASVSRKHIEVIIRQLFSRNKITDPGDTMFTEGDIVEDYELSLANAEVRDEGGEEAKAKPLIMGITEVALSRQSFLSAASFQNTNRVLINAAVRGSRDDLRGLKENVIIGRLIPAGTGFPGGPKQELVAEEVEEEEE